MHASKIYIKKGGIFIDFLVKNVNQKCKVEEKFKNLVKTRRIKFEIIPARKIILEKTNITLFDPFKIIFSKGEKKIIILYYDIYIKDEVYYLYDLKTEVTFSQIKKLLEAM